MIQTEHKLYEADRKPGPIVEAASWGFKGVVDQDDVGPAPGQHPPVEELAFVYLPKAAGIPVWVRNAGVAGKARKRSYWSRTTRAFSKS